MVKIGWNVVIIYRSVSNQVDTSYKISVPSASLYKDRRFNRFMSILTSLKIITQIKTTLTVKRIHEKSG